MNANLHPKESGTFAGSKPGLSPVVILYGIIILLGIGAGYLLFRNWHLKRQFAGERTRLLDSAQTNQLANDRQQLTFGMKTFVWAVRNSLLQNRPGEIREHFKTLVKDRGVKEVLLVDPAGHVTLSTNKKNEGIDFAKRYPAHLLQQQDVYFNDTYPYELSAPIHSTDRRLGTLVMFYTPTPILPLDE
ncbi:hypothetical protein [Larkinella soli]|uniref:hypothetical protein n=1 Tax=Larkinella soli TaxID=1770527 RepID=UPI001E32B30D|nr:hypothetical protein [Larkinella soli]